MPTLHPNQRSYSAPLTCLQNLWNFTKLYLLEWNKDPNNFFYFKRSKIRKCTSRVKIFTPWRCSELQVLRVLLYEPLNEVHLLQSQLDRVEMLRLARHVSRPKLCKRILWLIRKERERGGREGPRLITNDYFSCLNNTLTIVETFVSLRSNGESLGEESFATRWTKPSRWSMGERGSNFGSLLQFNKIVVHYCSEIYYALLYAAKPWQILWGWLVIYRTANMVSRSLYK